MHPKDISHFHETREERLERELSDERKVIKIIARERDEIAEERDALLEKVRRLQRRIEAIGILTDCEGE